MTPQQWGMRWRHKKSSTTAQPCVQRKMSRHREVLRVFSLCHQAEGHRCQEPLYSSVSCKHFQEEMPSNTLS